MLANWDDGAGVSLAHGGHSIAVAARNPLRVQPDEIHAEHLFWVRQMIEVRE